MLSDQVLTLTLWPSSPTRKSTVSTLRPRENRKLERKSYAPGQRRDYTLAKCGMTSSISMRCELVQPSLFSIWSKVNTSRHPKPPVV